MISFRGIVRLLTGNRNFRLLWSAQVISEVGDWLYAVVLYSLLLEITGRAESIGIALVLQLLPQLFVSPMAGVVNDHLSRKRVMIGSDVARAVIGRATIRSLVIDSERTRTLGSGTIDLGRRALDVVLTPEAKQPGLFILDRSIHLHGPLREPRHDLVARVAPGSAPVRSCRPERP